MEGGGEGRVGEKKEGEKWESLDSFGPRLFLVFIVAVRSRKTLFWRHVLMELFVLLSQQNLVSAMALKVKYV